MKIILASRSPRRREILENLGLDFEVMVSDADEDLKESSPSRLVMALAEKKAAEVKQEYEKLHSVDDALFIAADTVVYNRGKILGKPADKDDARRMLYSLSEHRHKVITGVSLIYNGRCVSGYETTTVRFGRISPEDIEACVAGGEPLDKAGAYAIQGEASRWISGIRGDYFNVVGLPVHRLCILAGKLGIKL